MLQELLRIGIEFKNIYFFSIEIDKLQNLNNIQYFAIISLSFFLFMIILHSIIIYIAANLNNSYPYFKMILLACTYSFIAAFSVSKIFQAIFVIAIYFMPYIGQYLVELGSAVPIGITFIFEYFLMKNRLKSLYQRGHLETEAINSDIFVGTIIATAVGFMIFFFI